jgi:hypothetical protein
MLIVKVVCFPKVLLQVIELSGGISRLWFRKRFPAEAFLVTAIPLSIDEFPFSHAYAERSTDLRQ